MSCSSAPCRHEIRRSWRGSPEGRRRPCACWLSSPAYALVPQAGTRQERGRSQDCSVFLFPEVFFPWRLVHNLIFLFICLTSSLEVSTIARFFLRLCSLPSLTQMTWASGELNSGTRLNSRVFSWRKHQRHFFLHLTIVLCWFWLER